MPFHQKLDPVTSYIIALLTQISTEKRKRLYEETLKPLLKEDQIPLVIQEFEELRVDPELEKLRQAPMLWDSLNRLHKISGLLLSVASEIDDFGLDLFAYGKLSDILIQKHGINLRQFQQICDDMNKIYTDLHTEADAWDKKYILHEGDKPCPPHQT